MAVPLAPPEELASAYAFAASARFEAGLVDRRLLRLLDEAVYLAQSDAVNREVAARIAELSAAVENPDAVRARMASRVSAWLDAGTGAVRGADETPEEETAWLRFLAERDCSTAVLDAGGGPDLPRVHRASRIAWYGVLAAAETSTAAAFAWAQRAQHGAMTLAADTGRPLRAGHAHLAWAHARRAHAPTDAAAWAVMAAHAFEAIGDAPNAAWAHLTASVALATQGRTDHAHNEHTTAHRLLDAQAPGLVSLLYRRAIPEPVGEEVPAPRPTRRERAVLALLADGLTAAAIARRLGISPRTVHHHLEHLYRKLDARDRLTAVRQAETLGLL